MRRLDWGNILFYCSFLLLRIPNFYLFPPIPNAFLTTQAIARILLTLSILILFLKNRDQFANVKIQTILAILLFSSQSLSILYTVNISAFINRYKDVLVSLLIFIVIQKTRINFKMLLRLFLYSSIINSIFALLIVYYPSIRTVLSSLIYDRYFDLVLSDIDRGRYYSTSYDEAIIPFVLYTQNYLIAGAILWVTFISNFRTKILASLFVVFSYLLLLKKNLIRSYAVVIASIVGILCIGILSAYFSIGNENYLDRFNLDEAAQTETLTSRKKQIEFSFDLGKTPFGIGLGNYYDYVPTQQKNNRDSISKSSQIHSKEVNDGIHNSFAAVLAESGYISFFIYLIVVGYFIMYDFLYLQKNGQITKRGLFIMSFWGLFMYGLFNPGVALSYQFQFWTFRGLIHNEYID